MGLYKGDAFLCIKNENGNLEVRNYTKTSASRELHTCNLNDFFSNNIGFEMSNISVLQLENCDICEIPRVIRNLNLKQLILTRNKLSEVPSCLYSGFKTLELLDLSHNFITNFDIEPACSGNIVTLKVADNQIRNFPHWILTVHCPKLVEVDYSNNYMRKMSASHQLTIKKLKLSNAQLLDDDFTFLKSIKSLEFLDVSNDKSGQNENRFNDINRLFIKAKWKNLKVLKLNNLMLSVMPKDVFWIASLAELHVTNCDLHWIPSDIQYLTNLTTLDVSENSICSIPPELAALPNISIFRAAFNYIDIIPEFTHDLDVLDLFNNQFETFPEFTAGIKFVDLEKNYVHTSLHASYETYRVKRDKLREMFACVRSNGPCDPPVEATFSENDTAEPDEFAENSTSEFYDANVETECWDEEEPVKVCLKRHPDVTLSDDEWTGKEETKIREKGKAANACFEPDEDWIFCDADEQ